MSLAWKYNEEDEIGFSEKNNVYAELQPFVGLMNSVSTGGKKTQYFLCDESSLAFRSSHQCH